MPIYEYSCARCGKTFEQLMSSADRGSAVSCPHCRSKRVARLLSAFAVSRAEAPAAESGSCGACGPAQRGLCGID
jgi:putative FmdB family regulatory protein